MDLKYGKPQNLMQWAETNGARLKPPVCNAAIFPDGNYIINMVGGPNGRSDFHDNPTEEIFHQIKGNAYLNVWDRGQFERIDLHEGDIFLLPAHLQHSPQRPEPGLCFLVEMVRPQGARDSLQWYCADCGTLVWRAEKQLESLVDDLPAIYQQFYALLDAERVCPACGLQHPGRDYHAWHAQLKNGKANARSA